MRPRSPRPHQRSLITSPFSLAAVLASLVCLASASAAPLLDARNATALHSAQNSTLSPSSAQTSASSATLPLLGLNATVSFDGSIGVGAGFAVETGGCDRSSAGRTDGVEEQHRILVSHDRQTSPNPHRLDQRDKLVPPILHALFSQLYGNYHYRDTHFYRPQLDTYARSLPQLYNLPFLFGQLDFVDPDCFHHQAQVDQRRHLAIVYFSPQVDHYQTGIDKSDHFRPPRSIRLDAQAVAHLDSLHRS
ncbi:Major Facilitator Superfamily protein [Rhodotorula toruloides]|nr:Major Facilitator Superfamily protein [Rhodotorula toruloides]